MSEGLITPESIKAPTQEEIKAMHQAIGKKKEVVTAKKQYQGVTIGMCMNNATQLCIAEGKYSAFDVVNKAKDLLEEMEREGL